ncbi:hypothetical protein [Vibrio metschnikovii]|uniref:hypothetical protein n=1 Tax=Vibrio metschnikovii TaxID=28172 RepID=UPI001C30B1C5|nr:hypothetical protein [Vibrio metschnikovii]
MEWSWKIFLIILPVAIIFSMFSRGAMNAQNVAKHGPEADYRANPSMAILGSIVGGIVWASVITVIIGLF